MPNLTSIALGEGAPTHISQTQKSRRTPAMQTGIQVSLTQACDLTQGFPNLLHDQKYLEHLLIMWLPELWPGDSGSVSLSCDSKSMVFATFVW